MTIIRRSIAAIAVLATAAMLAGAAEEPSRAEQLARRFNLSADDARIFATALGAVRDNTTQWRETAFYLLLGHVSKLPALKAKDLDALDQPAYQSLLDEPRRYRCRQVRMKVRVYRVRKLTSGKGMGPEVGWPRGKVAWRLICTTSLPKPVNNNAMTIFSTVEPPPLGKPSRVSRDGERWYDNGCELDVAAVFYKTYRDKEKNGGAVRSYPLLVARSVMPARGGVSFGSPPSGLLLAALAIAALGMTYYIVRRRVKAMRRKGAEKYGSVRQLRELQDQRDVAVDDDIDPLLKIAAERYRQERRHDDATDSQG